MASYAFDIDGTLTVETNGFGNFIYSRRTPNLTMIDNVNKLYNKGHMIILWTSRFEEDRKVTEEWLKKHNIKYHKLVMDKMYYDYLIDDKAITLL